MSIDEATEILAKQGVRVDRVGKNQFKLNYKGGEVCVPWVSARSKRQEGVWRGREVIQWARHPHNVSKGLLKHYDARKNRTATRDAIQSEDFDSIPQQGKTKPENKWNWD
jgi:hypothetical protein